MDELEMDEQFSSIAAIIGEKTRAKMLWHLLDGRAYTALELAIVADISKQSCSNHLKKLIESNILKVEKQGRHKYFKLYDKQVAKALEGMVFLTAQKGKKKRLLDSHATKSGIKYARSCYDHLAGYIGVELQENFIQHGLLQFSESGYLFPEKGIKKFSELGIDVKQLEGLKRKLAYPCLDWSERKHHIGGALGAALLQYMLSHDWLRKKKHSRELMVTSRGYQELERTFQLKIS